MKKLFLIALAFIGLSIFSASADSYSYKQGYRGNAGIGCGNAATLNIFEGWASFETNHGYSFGNGLYVGGGVNFFTHTSSKISLVPFYAELKYNFLNCLVSPYVDARVGALSIVNREVNTSVTGFLFAPVVGVDIWNISIGFTYGITSFASGTSGDNNYMGLSLLFNW